MAPDLGSGVTNSRSSLSLRRSCRSAMEVGRRNWGSGGSSRDDAGELRRRLKCLLVYIFIVMFTCLYIWCYLMMNLLCSFVILAGPGTVFCDNTSYVFMFLSIATSNLVATALARQLRNEGFMGTFKGFGRGKCY